VTGVEWARLLDSLDVDDIALKGYRIPSRPSHPATEASYRSVWNLCHTPDGDGPPVREQRLPDATTEPHRGSLQRRSQPPRCNPRKVLLILPRWAFTAAREDVLDSLRDALGGSGPTRPTSTGSRSAANCGPSSSRLPGPRRPGRTVPGLAFEPTATHCEAATTAPANPPCGPTTDRSTARPTTSSGT